MHSSLAGLGCIRVTDLMPINTACLGVTCTVATDLGGFQVTTAVWVEPEALDGHMTVHGYTGVDNTEW